MIRVDSDIVKRVVSMQYMKSMWGATFEEGKLPGKEAVSEEDIEQAVNCV